ncbi:MAG: hypothetical protein JSU85_12025 [Candidatus Zixiibacteriota bacterium]|nr:MAG: hypothetical protein JSU85_12025 [candidate division Zixibacteria bacterium]
MKKIRIFKPFPVVLLLWLTPVRAQVITNEQVVVRAAREGVESNFQSLRPGIINVKVLEDEISRPIAIGLSEGFKNLEIDVVGNDRASGGVQNLECDVLGFEFKYENGDPRGFLRKRMIRRKFMAVLKLTFSNMRNDSISEIRDITISYEDQINPEWGDLVKSRKIPALNPPFPSSGLKKVVEPVVVTAAVGTLIYLFFANR